MRNVILGAAVASALFTGGVASATTYELYISGASAQRSFWEGDFGAICTGTFGTGSVSIQKVIGGVPDIERASCTVTIPRAGVAAPTGLVNGDIVVLQYAAELGSVWGVAPFISGNAATAGRRFIDPAACSAASGTVCTISGYNNKTDTAASGMTGKIVPDVGVTDMEPVLWASEDNWPYDPATLQPFPILRDTTTGKQPSASQLASFQTLAKRVNGQVLSVVVNNAAAPTNGITNLSQESIRAIFTGQYTTWGQVPEAKNLTGAAATNITVCRREHGSGTQVAASTLFTKAECGGSNRFVSLANGPNTGANGGALATAVSESASTNDLINNCVTAAGNAGSAIGIRSLSPSASYNTVAIDGIQANAHNAAAGYYPLAFDAWVFNNVSATHGTGTYSNILTSLINDATRLSLNVLAAESGFPVGATPADNGGPWTTTAPKAAYYTRVSGSGNTQSITNLVSTSKAPVAIFDRGGDSCSPGINTNSGS
jgi:hypothetical protein